ncbi:hypothetical protein BJF88_14505 [Cellulosimicrobium sp. CUA-896]|nr:hypothetical protein BJF88_14505 [Cellulosimicrobium sp. CUA-896]
MPERVERDVQRQLSAAQQRDEARCREPCACGEHGARERERAERREDQRVGQVTTRDRVRARRQRQHEGRHERCAREAQRSGDRSGHLASLARAGHAGAPPEGPPGETSVSSGARSAGTAPG